MSDEDPTEEPGEPLTDLRDEIGSRSEDDESTDERGGSEDSSGDESPDESGTEAEGPLGDLRNEVDERADEARSDPADPDVDDRFAEMGVDDVDSEDLWADLLLDDGPTEGSFPPSETTHRADGTYHEVTKRLCHRCEYFGDPPVLHCTHEGTTIHELVDMDHYLVSDCPMVDTETGTEDRS
jgi:hypothetical protein